jgi:hypothetical protein
MGGYINQLPDYKKERINYRNFKEETLDHTFWRTLLGRSFGPVAR